MRTFGWRSRNSARMFGLSPLELRVVLLALAPELDLGYEKVFAYLQDDFNRRRPTVDLALRLFCAGTAERIEGRWLFAADAPLCRFGLLRVLDRADGPVLSRPLIVDDLTAAFVLRSGVARLTGSAHRAVDDDRPAARDLRWPGEIRDAAAVADPFAHGIARVVEPAPGLPSSRSRRDRPEDAGRDAVPRSGRADARGRPRRGAAPGDRPTGFEDGLRDVFRQAILLQAALYLEHVECLTGEDEKVDRNRRVFRRHDRRAVLADVPGYGAPWSPGDLFTGHTFVSIHLPAPGLASRDDLWVRLAAEAGLPTEGVSWPDLAARFRLTPGGMEAALAAARDIAYLRAPDDVVVMSDLIEACYMQSNRRLSGLARKLPKGRDWSDLDLAAQYSRAARGTVRAGRAIAGACTTSGASPAISRSGRVSARCSTARAASARRWRSK